VAKKKHQLLLLLLLLKPLPLHLLPLLLLQLLKLLLLHLLARRSNFFCFPKMPPSGGFFSPVQCTWYQPVPVSGSATSMSWAEQPAAWLKTA